MNWLAVIAKLDDIVEKRRAITEAHARLDSARITVDTGTQVIQAISAALKEGVRTPMPSSPRDVERARDYER